MNYCFRRLLQIPGFFSISPELKPVPGNHYHTIMVGLLHPLSRGSVHINSADPLAPPTIDPAYFSNPLDVDALVGGLRFCERLIKTPPYSEAKGIAYDPKAGMTDEEMADFVRYKMEPFYHPIATASMLPREDGGVVDSKLRVYGVKGLRVVDASVIPLVSTVTLVVARTLFLCIPSGILIMCLFFRSNCRPISSPRSMP